MIWVLLFAKALERFQFSGSGSYTPDQLLDLPKRVRELQFFKK